jgi:hypothetical protein
MDLTQRISEQYNVLDGQHYSLRPYTYGLFYIYGAEKHRFQQAIENSSAAFDDFRG